MKTQPDRKNARWRRERSGGFSLIELLAASAIFIIGVLGVIGMSDLAVKQNQQTYYLTTAVAALQDRIGQLQNVPRAYLDSIGVDTAYTCTTDAEPASYDKMDAGTVVENMMDPPGGIEEGAVLHGYTLEMQFWGVCSPERKDQQGLPNCVPTPFSDTHPDCPPGHKLNGGLSRNPLMPNTYEVAYTLSDPSGWKTEGVFWVVDSVNRIAGPGGP
ncbi:MAG: prepilin-type N-terminal cleavage/methylation domain-containing protein [Deltaproteobacteria bacterium]|nr:prepilin-type N-terminal cleavage/methylation domain-containing protein [Deltaproteobacteria bacterium]